MIKPIWSNGLAELYQADARAIPLPDKSVHCVITSPPYFGLRDYQLGVAGIGLEATLSEWVENIVAVMREVKRVLRDDGCLFLNLGDAYYGSGKGTLSDGTYRHGSKQSTNFGSLALPARPAHEPRVAQSGMNGKAPPSLRADDRTWQNLCDGCADFLRYRNPGIGDYLGPISDGAVSLSIPGHMESSVARTRSWHSASRAGQIANASPGYRPSRAPFAVRLPVFRGSTPAGFSRQSPDECWHCDNCASCLSVLRSSEPYALACARTGWRLGKPDRVDSQPFSGSHIDNDSSSLAYLHSTMPSPRAKMQMGQPWAVAFALMNDGWILRRDIIWAKPNPMPESVNDRPTTAHEYIFLFSKRGRYFYDAEAVRERYQGEDHGGHRVSHKVGDTADNRRFLGPERFPSTGRNARSVWTIATQGRPEAHFACVDAETEALTVNGWKRYEELGIGDTIATYNLAQQRNEWQRIDNLAAYGVSGQEMVVFKGRSIDQVLTPNHRAIVSTRQNEMIKRADEVRPAHRVRVAADWADSGEPFPSALAALIGWYVSEGHDKEHGAVELSQSETANPDHCAEIRRLLQAVNANYSEYERVREWRGRESKEITWHIIGQIAFQLLELCPRKTLPSNVLEWDNAALSALWDALIKSDGHRRSNGREAFVQKGRPLIDQVQAVATRLGFSTTLTPRQLDDDMWVLHRGERQLRHLRDRRQSLIGRETYTGIVWCPQTANGTWIARRNGRVFITGNTFPDELPRRCILAGTSAHGVCAECGAPWRRIIERQVGQAKETPKTVAAHHARGGTGVPVGTVGKAGSSRVDPIVQTLGWQPTCDCDANRVPATVLDPFVGSGTTCAVAQSLGRRSIGLDLNRDYLLNIARPRIQGITLPMELGV